MRFKKRCPKVLFSKINPLEMGFHILAISVIYGGSWFAPLNEFIYFIWSAACLIACLELHVYRGTRAPSVSLRYRWSLALQKAGFYKIWISPIVSAQIKQEHALKPLHSALKVLVQMIINSSLQKKRNLNWP